LKISLVEPGAADYHIYSKFPQPRLGLPLIGTMLARRGHNVRFYCDSIRRRTARDFADILRSDLVGISITTSTAPAGYRLGRALRLARVPVVFGGPHATARPEEALRYGDYVVRGEGEFAMLDLVEALGRKENAAGIANLSYRQGDRVVDEPLRPLVDDLSAIPWPDFALMKGIERMKVYGLATSRGCPRHCDFCGVTPVFGHKMRRREVDDVVAEFRHITQRDVFIVDDNFTAARPYARALLKKFAAVPDRPRWFAQAGVDIGRDEDLVKLMKRAGCAGLAIGLESISDETLAAYGKGQTRGDIERCLAVCRKHGIWVHGMFVLGGDGDGPDAPMATAAFAKKNNIDSVQFLALTPLPGTPLYDRLDAEGRIFNREWALYDGHHVVFEPARMTPLELQRGLINASLAFYSFRRVIHHLRRLQLVKAMITYYGYGLIRKWRRRKTEHLQILRQRDVAAPPGAAAQPVVCAAQEDVPYEP